MAPDQASNPALGSEPSSRWRAGTGRRVGRGVIAGLLSAAAALGVAELIAGFMGGGGSPVLAVGGAFVDATPRWLKEFAIETFGENDKNVLLIGIALTIAALAAVIGVVAQWRPRVGVAAVAVLGLVPAVAAVSRPAGQGSDAIPALVGAVVGAGFLWLFSRRGDRQLAQNAESNADDSTVDSSLSRRSFLLVAGAAAVVAATAGVVGRGLINGRIDVEELRAALRLPKPADAAPPVPASVQADVSGVSKYFTPNSEFYRVDTALSVPVVDSRTWRLRIHGMVEQELSYSFDDLLAMPLVERDITLTCVSNEVGGDLVGNARWLGVPVRLLLEEAGPASDADQVVSRSVDGMTIGTPVQALMDGRDALLAVGMNGEPLPVEHGFPVRMVVPGLYGYVSACKWIAEMELTTFDAYDPYWVERGWVEEAPIKLSARIDAPRPLAEVSGEVKVGGVAWAQHTGVAGVDVRLDGGEWQPADLAADGGIDSWRQWSWTLQGASAGSHTLEVRATDRDGNVQSGERVEPFPSGSTGWHSVVITVT
jgi:DMSO/TMAO reductase YedYZ molybdopterin-dependent catalytic subunit